MFRLLSKTDHRSFDNCRVTRNRWCAKSECHRFLSSIEKERNNATTTTSRTIVQSVNDFSPYDHSAGIFLGILGAATAGAAAIYGTFSYLNSEFQKERELRQEQVQKERELRQSEVLRVQAEIQAEIQKERELRQSEVQRVRAEMAYEVEKAREETTMRFLLYGYAEEFQRYQKTAGVYKDANDEGRNETATRSENTK